MKASAQSTMRGYVPQIDAMRAISVVAVMIYHMSPQWLPGGFCGVDVFLVISGYVVSGSLATLPIDSFRTFTLQFYLKRIRRIIPALLVCVFVTAVLTTLFVPRSWLSDTTEKTALFALFGASNFALMRSDSYFAPRADFNPFTHTWSLGVEEQFYFVFPALFLLWMRGRGAEGGRRLMARASLPLLCIMSLVVCAITSYSNETVAFYSPLGRLWELGVGALLFQFHSAGRLSPSTRAVQSALLAGSLLVILAAFVLAPAQPFPFPYALPAVLGAAGMLMALAHESASRTLPGRVLANAALVYVGRISYSLYLWHWPVYVLMRWTAGLDNAVTRSCALVITVLLAAISYHKIESTFRHGSPSVKRSTQRSVLAGLSAIVLVALATGSVFFLQPRLTLSVTRAHETWYPDDRQPNVALVTGHCPVSRLTSYVGDIRVTRYTSEACAANAHKTLYVAGDSHATAYLRLMHRIADETGIDVVVYHVAGCPVLTLTTTLDELGAQCRAATELALSDIAKKARTGDALFLPSLRLKRFSNQWGVLEADSSRSGVAAADRSIAVEEAQRLLDPLYRAGVQVIFEAPKPIFRAPAFRCSDWFNRHNPVCEPGLSMPRNFLERYRAPVMTALDELASRRRETMIFDPFYILCPGETCSAVDAGVPRFFDADHLSGHGNALLHDAFLGKLRAAKLVP